MAEYRTIRLEFWQDPEMEEWDVAQKYLYMYLFTCPYANNLGIIQASLKRIALETSLSVQDIQTSLSFLEAKGKVLVQGQYILVFNFIKHQTSSSVNVIKNLSDLTPSVPTPEMAESLFRRYPYIYGYSKDKLDPLDTLSIPYLEGMHTVTIGMGTKGYLVLGIGKGVKGKDIVSDEPDPDTSSDPKTKPEYPEEVARFVMDFQKRAVDELGPKAPKVNDKLIRDGCETLLQIVRLDGVELERIQQSLTWAAKDSFWRDNVRSLAHLRTRSKNNGLLKFQNLLAAWEKATAGNARQTLFAGGNVV